MADSFREKYHKYTPASPLYPPSIPSRAPVGGFRGVIIDCMRAGCTGSLLTLFLVSICSAQPAAYVEIKLPVGVRSETTFVRYALDGDFGGWVQPRPDISSYFISTKREGAAAARFRALVYAPGCAIQTVDLPVSGPAVPRYVFVCQPVPNVRLMGNLIKSDRLNAREISLDVKYVARWAAGFLGIGEDLTTDIPVGGTRYAADDGSFEISIPDFSEDPMASASDPGEFQILTRDRTNGNILAQLVPTVESLRTSMRGLQIRKAYPDRVEFAACPDRGPHLHDALGFSIRPTAKDVCDR
jgi:hypothetical protein